MMMSKTITQKIYEDSYTDELYMQRTSDERLAQYGDNDFSFLNDNRTINVEFDLDADPPTLIEDSKRGKYDGENAALFYNSYKSMPIDLAFDKKFWTYMTHNNYRAYTMIRFNVKSRAAQGRAQGTVQERFFTQSYSYDRGLERNSVARLWWAAHTTTNFENDPELDYFFNDTDDPYFYTKVLCSSQDLFVQLLGHSFGRNKKILLAALKHTAENNSIIKDKKAHAVYISNRICLYEYNNTLIFSSPEKAVNIIKDIAPV